MALFSSLLLLLLLLLFLSFLLIIPCNITFYILDFVRDSCGLNFDEVKTEIKLTGERAFDRTLSIYIQRLHNNVFRNVFESITIFRHLGSVGFSLGFSVYLIFGRFKAS